jgi:hypothetical protein
VLIILLFLATINYWDIHILQKNKLGLSYANIEEISNLQAQAEAELYQVQGSSNPANTI